MSSKMFQTSPAGAGGGPGSRTRRKMSGEKEKNQALGGEGGGGDKCKDLIYETLSSDGHRDMIKRMMQSRLAQAGWTYTLRTKYVNYIKEKGSDNVNVAHMIEDMIPQAMESFPDQVRKDFETMVYDLCTEFVSPDESCSPSDEEETHDDEYGERVVYQNRDTKPEPGIGYNVRTPEIEISRSPSPSSSLPRPLTPQPPIPVLRPEHIKIEEEDEDVSSNADENDEDMEEDRDDEGDFEGEISVTNHVESEEEEELMDV